MHTPRPWQRLSPDLFRFATTELYDLRVAIMCVFDDTAVLQPALSFEAVRSGLAGLGWDEPVDDAQLDQALGMLTGWGLLDGPTVSSRFVWNGRRRVAAPVGVEVVSS